MIDDLKYDSSVIQVFCLLFSLVNDVMCAMSADILRLMIFCSGREILRNT